MSERESRGYLGAGSGSFRGECIRGCLGFRVNTRPMALRGLGAMNKDNFMAYCANMMPPLILDAENLISIDPESVEDEVFVMTTAYDTVYATCAMSEYLTVQRCAVTAMTSLEGINTILDDYADRDEVSGTINSELGNYTNTVDVNAQLENYSTTSGIIEKPADYADSDLASYIQSKAISGGFNFESQLIKIRSQNIPDQADMEYPYIVPEGTYNAVETLEIPKNIIGGFMYAMFTEYGYAEIKNECKYNLDRFNPDFIVGKQDDMSFEIDLTDYGNVQLAVFDDFGIYEYFWRRNAGIF